MFAEHGFPVGPLCRPSPHTRRCSYPGKSHRPCCPDPGKKPIPYAGVKGFTTDAETIRQYWRWYPTANLGVAMGSRSGHFIIEVDGPNGQSLLRQFTMPPTPTVWSRRGPHLYLKIPPGYSVKTTHLDELDILGDGDQVVGPGSVHASGHIYTWHAYLSLTDLTPAEPPQPLISWLLDHGVFQPKLLATTPMYPQVQSRKQKSASHAFSRGDEQTRLSSGGIHNGRDRKASPAGGVTRLEVQLQDLWHPPLVLGWQSWHKSLRSRLRV
jgi:hypothetical protein